MTQSDNTAANLILKSLGGPARVTEFARSLGDRMTRLDRWETALNEGTPGDPRDTTTPDAMTANLRALVLGPRLSPRSRDQLTAWMISNKTGDAKLRAGLPKEWRIGDKTGGGGYGTMADFAVIWPTGRKPVIASIYMTETKASYDERNAAIAEIGRPTAPSTLADANAKRPAALFADLFALLTARAHPGLRRKLRGAVRLIDATGLPLDSRSADWSRFSAAACGAKAHVVYDPDADCPLYLDLTPANVNDITAAKAMPIEPGATYVFDLGYYDFAWWHALDQAGCRFVTRLKTNTNLS